ncbi:MAG: heparinase II/III family protein, partial [Clostridia bacterium]|nr:heparinase II/III family protein [Clostridia bacterium]
MNKKQITSFILAMVLCVSMTTPNSVFSADSDKLIFNESYNQYITNEVLYEADVRSVAHYVKEYKQGDKGLFMSTLKSGASLSYSFKAISDGCVLFDIMSAGKNLEGEFTLTDSKGKSVTAVSFEKYSQINTSNGRHIGGYSQNGTTRVGIVTNLAVNTLDIYINGKLVSDNTKILTGSIADLAGFSFAFASAPDSETDSGVIVDNIYVNSGNKFLKQYPTEKFNEETAPEVEMKFEGVAAGGKMLDTGFDLEPNFVKADKGNIIERRTEDDGNNVLLHERLATTDFHSDIKGLSSLSDYVVYEYDIKLLNPAGTAMRVWLKDSNAKYSSMCIFQKNGSLTLGTYSIKLAADRWYHISTVYNYFDRTKDYYLNGELVCENDPIESTFGSGSDVDVFRFHVPEADPVDTNHAKYYLDNIRVYESDVPLDDISGLMRNVEINRNSSVFESEKRFEEYLKGFISVHTRSGVVIKDSERYVLSTLPDRVGADAFVAADEICDILGQELETASDTVKINGTLVASDSIKESDGKTLIKLNTLFADIMGKKVFTEQTTLSDGMVIAGDTMFTPPADETELQLLNNFAFFVRPDEEAVMKAYENSPSKGVHPRIHASLADFERIKSEIKTDENKIKLYANLIEKADSYVANPTPVIYELRDGVRLLDVSREVLRNMYVLGMAYRLSGDKKYADRAWIDLKAVSEFPDWHPNHSLDPVEMSAAVSVGYDWMYDAFTDEQRKTIEQGVYNNLFYVACNSMQSRSGYLSGGLLTNMNHNLITNGGLTMGALCFMDVYPEICSYVLSNSIRSIGMSIYNYGPDGAWVEGPHYWEYSTQYTTKFLSSLDSALGYDFRMSLVEGLSTAAEFILNVQSDIGIFNYGDGAVAKQYVPEIIWLANKYNLDHVVPAWLELSQLAITGGEDTALALLWLGGGSKKGNVTMETDSFYRGENVVTFRDRWTNSASTFAGVHGGKTIVNQSHLDGGSFVFDSNGVRWASDPGSAPYDLPNAWDTVNGGRWNYYMTRAEAHNCLVINPDENADHNPHSTVRITEFESKPKGGIAVADTSELYSDDALSARRGFFFTDNRQSLVIRDEVFLKKESDVYWFMQTAADVSINGNTAILSYDGKYMLLEAMCDSPLQITSGRSVPLPSSPVMDKDLMPSLNRIAIKFKSSGDTAITVKLTPYGIGHTSVSDYHKNIDTWSIQDGEIAKTEPPVLTSAYADSRPLVFDSQRRTTISLAGGENAKYPVISAVADESKYTVDTIDEVKNGFTLIRVTDKANPLNVSIYSVNYKVVPAPREFDGMISVPVSAITVSSEPQPENNAYNVADSDIESRWSSKGENQWMILE